MKLFLLAVLVGVACSTPAQKISPVLLNKLETEKTSNIMVEFVGSNRQVLNQFETRTFATRGQRLTSLKASLQSHAQTSQKNVQEFLTHKSIPFRSFWISNQILIKSADKYIVNALANFVEVSQVYEEQIVIRDTPKRGKSPSPKGPAPLAEWGITRIQAEEAWRITNGSGVVVANIDTGVRYTHEALRDSYRGEYGWFDGYGSTDPNPFDSDGHGTHTMGTIVGSQGIGVAPGAQWMACAGCGSFSCTQEALNTCGEWVACPTLPDGSNEDCSKAPVLASNSWGGGGGNTWYEPITEAWITGGIVPVFSIGNSGTSCGTSGSPGDLRRVIGVGATNVRNELAYFSSVGPAQDGRIKPEVSAPGEDVRSSVPDSDTSYDSYSGTSMACPHVAGVTALLLSVDSNLTFGQVRQALLAGCDDNITSEGASCSGLNDGTLPNHHFGWGIINALKVVEAAKAKVSH